MPLGVAQARIAPVVTEQLLAVCCRAIEKVLPHSNRDLRQRVESEDPFRMFKRDDGACRHVRRNQQPVATSKLKGQVTGRMTDRVEGAQPVLSRMWWESVGGVISGSLNEP